VTALDELNERIYAWERTETADGIIRIRPHKLEELSEGRYKVGDGTSHLLRIYGYEILLDEWAIPEISVEARR
jgi:hypothetical protein